MTLQNYLVADMANAFYENNISPRDIRILSKFHLKGYDFADELFLRDLASRGFLDYEPYFYSITSKGLSLLREYLVIA